MAYRNPADPEPPPPSVDTSDLERGLRRKKWIMRGAVLALAVSMPGIWIFPHAYESYRTWKAERAYRADPQNHVVPLSAEDAAAVVTALDAAEALSRKHAAAFEALVPKLVDGSVGPRADHGRCPVDIPAPSMDLHASDAVGGDGMVSVVDKASLASTLVVLDATAAAVKEGQGTALPLSLEKLGPVHITSATAPVSRIVTSVQTRIGALRKKAAAPLIRREHASLVSEAKQRARNIGYDYEIVQVYDLWVPAESLGKHDLKPGEARARTFVWSPSRENVVCAASTRAKSSSALAWTKGTSDPQDKDLFYNVQRAVPADMMAAGPALR